MRLRRSRPEMCEEGHRAELTLRKMAVVAVAPFSRRARWRAHVSFDRIHPSAAIAVASAAIAVASAALAVASAVLTVARAALAVAALLCASFRRGRSRARFDVPGLAPFQAE